MRHLIIGASAAGIAAARKIRSLRPEDEITVVAKDTRVHSRCMLHHFLSGHKTADDINFAGADFFEKNRVRFLSDEEVTSISPDDRCVVTKKSGKLSWDALLIATGAHCFIPPVPGFREAEGKNLFGLRSLCDAEAIDAAAHGAKECVVVGSGLVGLDAAYALSERGVKCHIVEMESRVCPLQLDERAGEPYKKLFEEAGCTFHLGKKAVTAELDAEGRARTLCLESGERLPADFIIVTAGVRPNVEFLGDSVTVDRFVKVDDLLRTSADEVWAAGDVTGLSGIWPAAALQGETAARNMCGESVPYADRYAMKNTMNLFGLVTLSLGKNVPEPGDTVIVKDWRTGYVKVILRDGRVTHITLQGDISHSGIWQELIKRGVPVADVKKPVDRLTWADFWNVDDATGRYVWR